MSNFIKEMVNIISHRYAFFGLPGLGIGKGYETLRSN